MLVQEAGGPGAAPALSSPMLFPSFSSFFLPRSHRPVSAPCAQVTLVLSEHNNGFNLKQGLKLQFTVPVVSGVLLCGKGSCPAAFPQRNRKEMKTTKKSSF